ncbi:MAG: DUF512 domain-containing protein [Eubacteriales bacterium]|nr:DUF512 domain-containing protein [Eubacteriales bacterium]
MFEVKSVEHGSPSERCGIRPGDKIVSVNGEPLIDYIDYVYFSSKKKLKLAFFNDTGKRRVRIKKDEDESLGLEFIQPLLGKKRVCRNKCLFCFVDQLPHGMRQSLYLKDEDWRYSFVMGNYVTLSAVGQEELVRIIKRGVSPLFISVHTVDEKLRRFMLGNESAVPIRRLLKKLAARGIRFHAQAVICPGLNDGKKLEQTVRFLRRLYPAAMSLAVVPVGLTGFRQGLHPVSPVTKSMAGMTIKEVEKWQKECLNSIGTRFVFAADEYYIRAGVPLPPAEDYEAFDQIENGVGLMAKFLDEANTALGSCEKNSGHFSIATGQDAYPYLKALAGKVHRVCGAVIDVYLVENKTFGGGVTVSGLLGGKDFLRALRDKELGQALLIPASTLRDDDVFLDDMTLDALNDALRVPVYTAADGYQLIDLLSGRQEEE